MVRSHTDTPVGRLYHWVNIRFGGSKFVKSKLNYVFPEHFSFLFGEIALYSFLFLVATGTFLAFFYVPSAEEVIYEGPYLPLRGVPMSRAYKSVVDLSFSVRAGLVFRQAHHWAALVFVAAILAHMCRVFFTGAFRRPREMTWMVGVTLFVLATAEGYVGYSLLDDLLSGNGLRIAFSVLESIPVVGSWLAFWLFGGEYPGGEILHRFFSIHIFILPALLGGLIALHLASIFRQHHTQFAGEGKTEDNVVGSKMWPTYATMSLGWMLIVSAVLVFAGGVLQINPVWLYGPYHDYIISSGAQADWYVLWIQGALRLMPGVSLPLGSYTVPNQFFPAVLFPGLVFGTLFFWPFIEAKVTGDRSEHNLLDRPRDNPVRSGIGGAGLAGLLVLLVAGSDDVMAATWDWNVIVMRYVERGLLFAVPALVGYLTWRVCHDLAGRDEQEADDMEKIEEAERESAGYMPVQPRRSPPVGSTAGRLGRVSPRVAGARRGVVTASVLAAVAGAVVDRLRGRSSGG